jgi:ABC-type sugar transport system permease subunit
MTISLMGNAEQASITTVRFVEGAPAGDILKVTVRNVGVQRVVILQGYANEIEAANIDSGSAFVIPKASSLEISLTFPKGILGNGTYQTVKLVTTKGTTFVYSLNYDSTNTSVYNPLLDDIASKPIPIPSSELPSQLNLSSFQAMVLFATSVADAIIVVGACLLANYALQPKNRKEFFALLFFVTLIVVLTTVAIVFRIAFSLQVGLM